MRPPPRSCEQRLHGPQPHPADRPPDISLDKSGEVVLCRPQMRRALAGSRHCRKPFSRSSDGVVHVGRRRDQRLGREV